MLCVSFGVGPVDGVVCVLLHCCALCTGSTKALLSVFSCTGTRHTKRGFVISKNAVLHNQVPHTHAFVESSCVLSFFNPYRMLLRISQCRPLRRALGHLALHVHGQFTPPPLPVRKCSEQSSPSSISTSSPFPCNAAYPRSTALRKNLKCASTAAPGWTE